MRLRTGGGLCLAASGVLLLFALSSPATAAVPPTFGPNVNTSRPHQGGGWNEPSGIAGSDGSLYSSFQNAQGSAPYTTGLSRSTDGRTWAKTGFESFAADPSQLPLTDNFGDVTMAADHAGTVFLGFIDQVLQAEIAWTRDGGRTWHAATNVAQLPGASSSSPFLVDRPWITAYSPDADFHHTKVYLEYHDFVPSIVWVVTCSMASGSLSCGAPIPTSNPDTFCNSIPGGIAVSPAGSRHPGRVFAVWSTADVQTNATSGCNDTQLAPFYKVYSAWSDTPDSPGSWTVAPVYVGPAGAGQNCPGTSVGSAPAGTNTCADDSEIFNQVAVDSAGNAYVAFIDYVSTIDKHYDVYLASSTDGGSTWDGKADGSGAPHLVSRGGTHFFPVLTAGDRGRLDVAYIGTSYSATPYQDGATCPTGLPPETSCQGKAQAEPPTAAWYTYLAQSLNADTANPTFTEVRVSDAVIHYGDVCNLGIYCDTSPSGNRSLWDTISVFTDSRGYAVVLWTDQRADTHGQADAAKADAQDPQAATDQVYSARQVGGPSLFAGPGAGGGVLGVAKTPPFTRGVAALSPLLPLVLVAIGLALTLSGAAGWRRRRSARVLEAGGDATDREPHELR